MKKVDKQNIYEIYPLDLIDIPARELPTEKIVLVLDYLSTEIESIEKKCVNLIDVADVASDLTTIGAVSFIASRLMPEGFIKNAFTILSPALFLTGIIGNAYVFGKGRKTEPLLDDLVYFSDVYSEFRNEFMRRKEEYLLNKHFKEIFPDAKTIDVPVSAEDEKYYNTLDYDVIDEFDIEEDDDDDYYDDEIR